ALTECWGHGRVRQIMNSAPRGCRMTRIVLRIVTVSTILACALVVTTRAASGGEQRISGRRLVLRDNPQPASRRIAVRSNDVAIPLGAGNGSVDGSGTVQGVYGLALE